MVDGIQGLIVLTDGSGEFGGLRNKRGGLLFRWVDHFRNRGVVARPGDLFVGVDVDSGVVAIDSASFPIFRTDVSAVLPHFPRPRDIHPEGELVLQDDTIIKPYPTDRAVIGRVTFRILRGVTERGEFGCGDFDDTGASHAEPDGIDPVNPEIEQNAAAFFPQGAPATIGQLFTAHSDPFGTSAAKGAEFASSDHVAGGTHFIGEAVLTPEHVNEAGFLHPILHLTHFYQITGGRFFAKDMQAPIEGGEGGWAVEKRGERDDDGVEFFAIEEFPIVMVGRDGVIGAAEIGLHFPEQFIGGIGHGGDREIRAIRYPVKMGLSDAARAQQAEAQF